MKELRVVFDNVPGVPGLITGWGFAAVVSGYDRTILFDTGSDGAALLSNMRTLSIPPQTIGSVVLSHAHADHAGGLPELISAAPGVDLIVPEELPRRLEAAIEASGATWRTAAAGEEIAEGVTTTGAMRGRQIEQGLILEGDDGPVLVTGCAHPGIHKLVELAKEVLGQCPFFIIGGFHLHDRSEPVLNRIVTRLQELGVQQAAPCHCSGDRARQVFKQRFGDKCHLVGVGQRFSFKPPADAA